MIFKSPFADIEIPVKGVYQYVTTNPNGIRDDKILFIDGMTDKKLTYGAVKSRSRRFAAGLIDRAGFKRGDVLAIFSPNQVDFSIVTLGTIIAGGKVTFANYLYTVEELAYQLKDSGARYLVTFPSCLTTAIEAAAVAKIPRSNVFLFGDQGINKVRSYLSLLSEREAIPIEYSPEEAKSTTAYICYSSGTSGRSKGVELTHASFVANMAQIHRHEDDILPDSTLVGVLPFYHVYGLMLLNHLMILKGSSIVTMPSFDLTNFCRIIQEYKVSTLPVVPPIVLLLVKDPTSRRYDLSSLKLCISGAAPLSKELAQEFVRTFNVPIKQGYGLTETSTVSHLTKTNRIVVGSIGKPLPNVECKLLSEEGRELGYNQPGELCVRGPNIMKGYLNNREATDACIDGEGWFHTGDIAMVDDSGYFYIVGRVKELIKYKGLQISPVELESILITHPSIADAAVIGVYSEQDATEYPVAYVVLRPNAPPSDQLKEEIKGYLAQRVTPHKKLRGGVLFIGQIPKSAAGKILRRILIERIKDEHPIYTKGSYQNPLLSQSKL